LSTPGWSDVRAMTLHRLLGAYRNGNGFRHHKGNPISADLVVVDEASMIDVGLMTSLIDALPSTCRLVLLGDAEQLSSVGAGSVFGDLCRGSLEGPLAARIHRFTTTHRFAEESGLSQLAELISSAPPARTVEVLKAGSLVGVEWFGSELPEGGSGPVALAMAGYQPYVGAIKAKRPLPELRRLLGEFRLINAIRRGSRGIDRLNALLEEQIRTLSGGALWYHGRAIVVQQNDYRLGLFNGDLGIVVERSEASGGGFEVCFGEEGSAIAGGEIRVPVERLPRSSPAWALTVHGAQGAEFSHVLLVLPGEAPRALSRELLYTGVTRARQRLTLVGPEQALEMACGHSVSRASSIAELAAESGLW